MTIHEFDYRYDWLEAILGALGSGFGKVQRRGEADDSFDGLWQMEHHETIFGIAFVATQTYILGTTQDINKIRRKARKGSITKSVCYADDIAASPVAFSRISLINEIANYFKHNDEWGEVWPIQHTTKFLALIGIHQSTEFPCYNAAVQLDNDIHSGHLNNILPIVSGWRSFVLQKYS